jgi:hypothetical protein
MLRKSLVVAISAAVVSAFGLGVFAPTAEAVTAIGNISTIITAADPNVQLAYVQKKVINKKKRHHKTVWVYSRKSHGLRYHSKRGPYAYYYGGYYYSRPWWTIGGPGLNLCIGC